MRVSPAHRMPLAGATKAVFFTYLEESGGGHTWHGHCTSSGRRGERGVGGAARSAVERAARASAAGIRSAGGRRACALARPTRSIRWPWKFQPSHCQPVAARRWRAPPLLARIPVVKTPIHRAYCQNHHSYPAVHICRLPMFILEHKFTYLWCPQLCRETWHKLGIVINSNHLNEWIIIDILLANLPYFFSSYCNN